MEWALSELPAAAGGRIDESCEAEESRKYLSEKTKERNQMLKVAVVLEFSVNSSVVILSID